MSVHEHCPHTSCCYFIIHRDQRRLYAHRACVSSVSMSVSFCNWVDVCTQPSPETLISYVHCACGSSVVNHTWSSPAPCADNIWAVNRWNNILNPSADKSEATVILAWETFVDPHLIKWNLAECHLSGTPFIWRPELLSLKLILMLSPFTTWGLRNRLLTQRYIHPYIICEKNCKCQVLSVRRAHNPCPAGEKGIFSKKKKFDL